MQLTALGVMIWALIALAPVTQAEHSVRPPNIVYVVSDEGWADVGSNIRTPNLDELANGGVKLEHFYAQPMCTPTRAALMTRRYPFRYGLQTAVIPSSHTYGVPTDEWLVPQALGRAPKVEDQRELRRTWKN